MRGWVYLRKATALILVGLGLTYSALIVWAVWFSIFFEPPWEDGLDAGLVASMAAIYLSPIPLLIFCAGEAASMWRGRPPSGRIRQAAGVMFAAAAFVTMAGLRAHQPVWFFLWSVGLPLAVAVICNRGWRARAFMVLVLPILAYVSGLFVMLNVSAWPKLL